VVIHHQSVCHMVLVVVTHHHPHLVMSHQLIVVTHHHPLKVVTAHHQNWIRVNYY